MQDAHRPRQRFMSISQERFIPSAALTLCVILPAIAGLLCSCQSAAWQTKRRETEGQRIIPHQYAQMRKETFSEDQWLDLLRQRVHQPVAIWRGTSIATINDGGVGLSFQGLTFRDSPSYVLENHLWRKGLLRHHPFLFLRLFDDPDPETVLTGVRVYYTGPSLDKAAMNTIAKAIRDKLLGHMDVRVRHAGIYTLGQYRQLTPEDVRRGLDDESNEVRVTTAFWLSVMTEQWDREDRQAKENASQAARGFGAPPRRTRDALLAATLLDHLNDNDPFVRQRTSVVLRQIFRRRLDELQAAGLQGPADLPAKFDWVWSDWHTRQATQAEWKQWWTQRGMALGKYVGNRPLVAVTSTPLR